jgi:type VI secretion system VasD/TssJ family lipoprotein
MRIFSIWLCLTSALLGGCQYSPLLNNDEAQATKIPVAASFSPNAISIEIQADPDLNVLHGMANSCSLLVLQSATDGTLNKLLASPDALKSLFNDAGAQNEILKVDKYAAMPGQVATLHIDRSENARYVAIVAGYYPFPQLQQMRLVAIPTKLVSNHWWQFSNLRQLASLTLKIRLGKSGITRFSGANAAPLKIEHAENDIPGSAGT